MKLGRHRQPVDPADSDRPSGEVAELPEHPSLAMIGFTSTHRPAGAEHERRQQIPPPPGPMTRAVNLSGNR